MNKISLPKIFTIKESLIITWISIYYYFFLKGELWNFLLLWLIPDISMAGYVFNKKIGAITYNIFHNYSIPLIMFLFNNPTITLISLIWINHIAVDRVLGYGLKHKTGFKHTHIQKI